MSRVAKIAVRVEGFSVVGWRGYSKEERLEAETAIASAIGFALSDHGLYVTHGTVKLTVPEVRE